MSNPITIYLLTNSKKPFGKRKSGALCYNEIRCKQEVLIGIVLEWVCEAKLKAEIEQWNHSTMSRVGWKRESRTLKSTRTLSRAVVEAFR